jgi:DDE superfamily endonuclease/Helix-turn-helix of DDE superfamily endonuclease
MLDVPVQLVVFVSRLLAGRRGEIGTRRGTRALTCFRQAVFVLAWFRDRPDIARLGKGFGISQATVYRYLNEAIEVLADRAPTLRQALEKAKELGPPYLILDGTVVAADRCAEKTMSRKGREIDRWYSGKAHHPGGNIQALSAPGGIPLWVSGVLPGSTHDLTAARQHVLPGARPYLKDLPVLAGSGYEGAGAGVHVPVKKPPRGGELDIGTRTRNALLRSLRYQGGRGFALMSQRWRTLQRVMLSPGRMGDIAQAALVLVQFEHKMITLSPLRPVSSPRGRQGAARGRSGSG